MKDRRRFIAVLLVLLTTAAACGGRLSEQEISAELAADGVGTGSPGGAGGFAAGDGTSSDGAIDDFTADDSFAGSDPASSGGDGSAGPVAADGGAPAGDGGASGSPQPGAPTAGGGAPAAADPATAAPAGGNGGATDVGVTPTEIMIGNVSTLSGPVPGLFRGALVGTQAAFAYQNSQGGLFGRSFKIVSGDDNFDAGQNRSRVKELKDKVFAFVGSFSLSDGAGAPEMQSSGVLDIGRALNKTRQDIPTHMSPSPFKIGWSSTGCEYLKKRFGAEKIKKMAIFWGNADAARTNAAWQQNACESVGFEFVYGREFQATETNFTTDAIRMRNEGVQGYLIVFDVTGIGRFMKSMKQQGFVPPMVYPSPAAYDSALFKAAGADAAEGAIIGQNLSMYLGQDAQRVPEIARYLEWMKKVDPSQKIDIFSFYGWLSGRLTVEAMKKAGPKATRAGVLEQLKGIHQWDNFGTTEPVDVGNKLPGVCEMYMEIRGGKFVRIQPANGFQCDGKFVDYSGNGTPSV